MKKEKDAAQLALEKLTPQQRKFVEGFCATFNATKAAEQAKYSKKTARQQGSRLLTIVDIKTAVKAVLDKSAMEPEEIAARWTRLARAGLDDFYSKRRVEYTPRIEKPLSEVVSEYRAHIEFEQELAIRAEALLSDKKERESFRKKQQRLHREREYELLRMEMELEKEPTAIRFVDGPKQWREEMTLDLVKAEELGMLELVKAITPTEFGLKVELRSPDAAMDNLAKWRGMLTNKVDITTKGAAIGGPDLSNLSNEELAIYETLLRKATPPKS